VCETKLWNKAVPHFSPVFCAKSGDLRRSSPNRESSCTAKSASHKHPGRKKSRAPRGISHSNFPGAIEGTRTPTPLRVHGPEPCASANSATMASGLTLQRRPKGRRVRKTNSSILQTRAGLSNYAIPARKNFFANFAAFPSRPFAVKVFCLMPKSLPRNFPRRNPQSI
jgi:hypothetical protein